MLFLVKTYPFVLSFLLGLIPALVWLWFWLKEDTHPEPAKNLTLSFLGGMLAVIVALPIQRYIYDNYSDNINISFALWASIEEISKFTIVYLIALRKE